MKSKKILMVTLRREEFAGYPVTRGKIFPGCGKWIAENQKKLCRSCSTQIMLDSDHARLKSYRHFGARLYTA
jgi:hypothetical protein